MKPQINKSNLMKRAWAIYRMQPYYHRNFGLALKIAWDAEKRAMQPKKVEVVHFGEYEQMYIVNNYYNRRPGAYCGD